MKLIKNAVVYAPQKLGKKDVLIAGGKIIKIQDEIRLEGSIEIEILDAEGFCLLPGFLDTHVHITGGGGEGGFSTRTPEIMLSDITKGGITTIIGTLGTDGTTRTMTNLLAKAHALQEEGITTFVNTGSYHVPVKTVTGSITDDIILIDKIIGVGEVAVSDHRSSQPTFEEFSKLVSEARIGGMLSGKAGTVNIHMGDSSRMLDLLEAVIEKTEIPMKHMVPTHMNRNPYLFQKSLEYRKRGGFVDFTTSMIPSLSKDGEVAAYHTLKIFEEENLSLEGVTFSSDGQGSLPIFNEAGEMSGIGIGQVTSLYQAIRDSVLIDRMDLEKVLPVITSNPASIYKLNGKGMIKEGFDADMVLVEQESLQINTVISRGVVMIKEGLPVVKGTFES